MENHSSPTHFYIVIQVVEVTLTSCAIKHLHQLNASLRNYYSLHNMPCLMPEINCSWHMIFATHNNSFSLRRHALHFSACEISRSGGVQKVCTRNVTSLRCPSSCNTVVTNVEVQDTDFLDTPMWTCQGLRRLQTLVRLLRHHVLCLHGPSWL